MKINNIRDIEVTFSEGDIVYVVDTTDNTVEEIQLTDKHLYYKDDYTYERLSLNGDGEFKSNKLKFETGKDYAYLFKRDVEHYGAGMGAGIRVNYQPLKTSLLFINKELAYTFVNNRKVEKLKSSLRKHALQTARDELRKKHDKEIESLSFEIYNKLIKFELEKLNLYEF